VSCAETEEFLRLLLSIEHLLFLAMSTELLADTVCVGAYTPTRQSRRIIVLLASSWGSCGSFALPLNCLGQQPPIHKYVTIGLAATCPLLLLTLSALSYVCVGFGRHLCCVLPASATL
jgi:hypothetical protein